MIVSVVICTYNRAEYLRNTLHALEFQRYKNFEVVVVNGPSTDHTSQVLEQYRDRIKLVNCDVANLSVSRNIGIAHSAGEIVAFLDDDGIPVPEWLDRLLIGYSNDLVAGVGGFIRDHTGFAYQARATVCDRFADAIDYPTSDAAQVKHTRGGNRYFSLTGCNSSFRRQALLEIGGFDEEYAYFLDETDVCLRLVDAGYELAVIGTAEVYHKYAESHIRSQTKVPKSIFTSVKSKAYFCAKHNMYDIDGVYNRLIKYRHDLRLDKKWLWENNVINSHHYDTLIAEIDSGIERGLEQAHAFPKGQHNLSRHSPQTNTDFRAFPRTGPSHTLRLCMISREYGHGPVGGIAKWTRMVAEALAARGHEISVVSLSSSGFPTVDFENGVWVHRVVAQYQPTRSYPPLPRLPQILKDHLYTVFDEVMRIMASRGLDLVSAPIWDLEGLAVVNSGALPVVTSLHTTYKLALPSKLDWQTDALYLQEHVNKVIAAETELLRKSNNLLANSHGIVEDIRTNYHINDLGDRVSVVLHGVEDHRDSDTKSNLSSDAVRLLFVGRFERRKGIDLLLAALPDLLSEFSGVEVELVGDHTILEGGKNQKAEFLTKNQGAPWLDRISFRGTVSFEELHAAYERCDLFVGPSRYESFGLIYVEAASHGKPSIGPDVGGVKEVIIDGSTGFLFQTGDVHSLKEAIRVAVSDKEKLRELGHAARIDFEQRFTVDKMAENLEHYYLKELQ